MGLVTTAAHWVGITGLLGITGLIKSSEAVKLTLLEPADCLFPELKWGICEEEGGKKKPQGQGILVLLIYYTLS